MDSPEQTGPIPVSKAESKRMRHLLRNRLLVGDNYDEYGTFEAAKPSVLRQGGPVTEKYWTSELLGLNHWDHTIQLTRSGNILVSSSKEGIIRQIHPRDVRRVKEDHFAYVREGGYVLSPYLNYYVGDEEISEDELLLRLLQADQGIKPPVFVDHVQQIKVAERYESEYVAVVMFAPLSPRYPLHDAAVMVESGELIEREFVKPFSASRWGMEPKPYSFNSFQFEQARSLYES